MLSVGIMWPFLPKKGTILAISTSSSPTTVHMMASVGWLHEAAIPTSLALAEAVALVPAAPVLRHGLTAVPVHRRVRTAAPDHRRVRTAAPDHRRVQTAASDRRSVLTHEPRTGMSSE